MSSIDLETSEQLLLRKAVADVAGSFGNAYYRAKTAADERTHELWGALAQAGSCSRARR